MIRIIYNGAELDVEPDSQLQLSYRASDLSELGTRGDTFSTTYELPFTSNNRIAFGFADRNFGQLDAASEWRPCQIYNNDTLVLNGFARLNGVRKPYELFVVGALIGIRNAYEGVALDQIPLGETYAPKQTNLTNLVAYPRLADGALDSVTTNQRIPFIGRTPFVNLRLYAHYLLERLGYTVVDTVASGLQLSTYIGGEIRHAQEEFSQQSEVFDLTPGFYTAGTDIPLTPQLGSKYTVTNGWTSPYAGYVQVDWQFVVTPNPGNIHSMQLLEGTTAIARQNNNDTQDAFSYQFTTYISGGLKLFLRAQTDITIRGDRTAQLKLTPLDLVGPNQQLTARNLPDTEPWQIIKEYCNRFGKLLTVNEDSRTITFQDLAGLDATNKAIDWTDKVCTDEQVWNGYEETKFNYGNFARNNWYRNAGTEGAFAIVSLVGNETNKDVYTSIYATPLDQRANVQTVLSSPVVQRFVPQAGLSIDYYNQSNAYPAGRDIVTERGDFFRARIDVPAGGVNPYDYTIPQNAFNPWTRRSLSDVYQSYQGVSLICSLVNTSGFLAPFNTANGITIRTPLGGGTNVANITNDLIPVFALLHWSNLIPLYQEVVQRMVLQPRIDRVLMLLNIGDVSNINFGVPYLVDGCYYYLSLIDQYTVDKDTPTICELVRIPPQ